MSRGLALVAWLVAIAIPGFGPAVAQAGGTATPAQAVSALVTPLASRHGGAWACNTATSVYRFVGPCT